MDTTSRYLRFIVAIAVVLTLLIIAYTMNSASQGNRSYSSNEVQQPPVQDNPHQSNSTNNPVPKELFPASIDGMVIVDSLSGVEAIDSVSQLHGTDIAVSTAYIVSYQSLDNLSMQIWYEEAKTVKDATALFQIMDQKMPDSQVFKNYQTIKIDNKDYKSVTGMELQHYYWQSGKRVIWIAIGGTSDSASILKQVAPLY